jgi:hypothetical protein
MANSTSQLVGDTAKAIVDGLQLVSTPSVKRKTPSFPEGSVPPLPQLVISVSEEGKTEYLTATQKLKRYPVAVTIVTSTGHQLADDNTVRQWRQQIEMALEKIANWAALNTTNSTFNEANLTNKPPFDVSALSKDFNYAVVVVEVFLIEPRG